MLGKVVVYNEDILTLLSEILSHCTAGVGGNILKRSRFRCGCRHNYCVIHGTVFLKLICKLNYRCVLLTDCHIDTYNIGVFLIYYCVNGDFCFTCLTVADNKLSLSSSYWYHGVNSLNTCLQRHRYALSFNYAGSLGFNGSCFSGFNGSFAVYGLTESIYNSS